MKKILSFLILFVLLLDGNVAKAQQLTFNKVFFGSSDSIHTYGMIKTPDSNYLIAGERNQKPFVMMMDPLGNIIWSKNYGTAQGNIYSLAATNDSHFLLAGDLGNYGGSQFDVLLIKITPAGDTVWSRTIDLGYSDHSLFVKQTSDNGFILTGYAADTTAPVYRASVIKLDASGNISWSKVFYSGNWPNYAFSATESSDGGYFITGSCGTSSNYSGSLLLMKLNSSGSVVWSEKESIGTYPLSSGNDIVALPDGLICYFTTSDYNMYLMKTDLSGNVIWCNYLGYGANNTYDAPSPKLHQTSDGGYIFVNGSNMWGPMGTVLKVDSSGQAIWGASLFLLSSEVLPVNDGGYLISGNGPIMGVKDVGTTNPQIGIIKIGSNGSTSLCVNSLPLNTTPYSITMVPVSLTSASAGIESDYHPKAISLTLLSDSGCVAITGGIEKTAEANPLKVMPNPSDGVFRLELNGEGQARLSSIEIYNMFGETVFRSTSPVTAEQTINTGFLPSGIYETRCMFRDTIYTQKIIIVH